MTPGLGDRARGPVAVIALPPRADADCILALRHRSERALVSGSRAITIDLRALDHIDTQTLSELSIALHRIGGHQAKVAVVGADSRIRWVLELCGIDGLEFHPTIRRALADVREHHRAATRPSWRYVLRRRRPTLKRSRARA